MGRASSRPSVSDPRQVEHALRTLLASGAAMLGVVVAIGILRGVMIDRFAGVAFAGWGLIVAFSACLTGAALGLLFGLPTVRRTVSDGAAKDGSTQTGGNADVSTGYIESTSLEQISDFLVKGIVALALTTFESWSVRFDRLAEGVTHVLLGRGLCPPGARDCLDESVPGGLLLAGFALLGFLLSYLWMRRWFINEMVFAGTEQRGLIRDEQARVAQAEAAGLTGKGAPPRNEPAAQIAAAVGIVRQAASLTSASARASIEEVERILGSTSQDPDDPWKGAFGNTATANGCALSASITALAIDSDNFQVDILAAVVDPDRLSALVGGNVCFFLHPTFEGGPRAVRIAVNGTAPLQIFSYGGFTVGALLDDGTRLELDLARLPGAPQRFVER